MQICTFDKCVLASMDILTKEGKLQCCLMLMGLQFFVPGFNPGTLA